LVRDDFWLAVSRFLRELEIRLVEGQNSALADLFDGEHAKKVLAAFGRAFGRLPESSRETTKDQMEFLKQAIQGLAQDGKVICVRLALFAEMMKGKAWSPATLKEVGGTEGVGVTFLEETFSVATAPPQHRYHQKAARAVLKSLLPESGTDIKGHMRSYAELLEASCYGSRPRDFDDLIRILDGEIRLITPTDPEGHDEGGMMNDEQGASAGSSPIVHRSSFRFYQLTHDYLVPSLRDWLTRKQKETRRGRAQLRLAERSAVWNAKPQTRYLPAWWEWANIRLFTRKRDWTAPQRNMMGAARRYHVTRGLILTVLLALLSWGGWEVNGRFQADVLCGRLMNAPTDGDVLRIVREMRPYRRWTDRLLRHAYGVPAPPASVDRLLRDADGIPGPAPSNKYQLHASLGLLPVDPGQANYLYDKLLRAPVLEVVVIRDAMVTYLDKREDVAARLWVVLEDAKKDQDQRLRAACALAAFAPQDARWPAVSTDVAERLVAQNALVLRIWIDAFQPVGNSLLPSLAGFLEDEKRSGAQRRNIATVFANYAGTASGAFVSLERGPFPTPTTPIRSSSSNAASSAAFASLEQRLAKRADSAILVERQANVAAALLAMGRDKKVWPLLKHSPDLSLRSFLIEALGSAGPDAAALVARIEREPEISTRRAILLSLGSYGLDRLSLAERDNWLPMLSRLYHDDPDPGIHGAAEWLLRSWGQDAKLRAIDKELMTGKPEGKRNWYINGQGQTMVVVAKPGEVLLGGKKPDDWPQHKERIDWSFAIASKELTRQQFLKFRGNHRGFSQIPDGPVDGVSWYDAAWYCNWLSKTEGIKEDQWCYLPSKAGKYAEGMRIAPDSKKRTGYRLPTEAEWEFSCRAGAMTPYCCGSYDELVAHYGWYVGNSLGNSHPVATLKPNDLGLFDMHGNVWEWCLDRVSLLGPTGRTSEGRVLRGGTFTHQPLDLRSSFRYRSPPDNEYVLLGFRVARTLTAE